jgi:hypothetical protein
MGVNQYGLLAIGAIPGYNSIFNSIALSGGIPGRSSGNTSRNSQTTWISSIFLSTMWCMDALMREISEWWRVTFPYRGEFRWTSRADMSSVALCHFIQLIPRMASIPWSLSTMRSVSNIRPTKSSGALRTSRSRSTRPLGVLIMYGIPEATSDNLAFLA